MRVSHTDATMRIFKLHGSPTFNEWSSAGVGGTVGSYAPGNRDNEADGAVAFYWNGTTVRDGAFDEAKWGYYTANTGGVSITMDDDLAIQAVAAGGREGVITTRPWVFDGKIRHDDGAYTRSNLTSDRFGTAVGDDIIAVNPVLLSHPTNPRLYVGWGNTVAVYSPSEVVETFTVPGSSPPSDFTWYDGQLWFSAGNAIYRLPSTGAPVKVTDADTTILPGRMFGRFCIQGGELILADGNAVRISDGRVRSWISSGDLTTEQQAEANVLRALVGSGCTARPPPRASTWGS